MKKISGGSNEYPPSMFWAETSVAKDTKFLHADSKDSDQTGRMLRLI